MGNEFAQGLEWRFYEQLEWELLNKKENIEMLEYVKSLNKLYLKEKSLWEDTSDTFEWIEHENFNENMIIFLRKTKIDNEYIIGIFNFSGIEKRGYKVGVPENKIYYILLNSDDKKYGGTGLTKRKRYSATKGQWNQREQHIEIDIQANSVIFLKAEKRKVKN